uniref:Uncharacterized protein n=1 Tax=Rhizophora mucronata TaxID=61149 RepID=A0A2P2Q7M3_RHIMU
MGSIICSANGIFVQVANKT